MISAQDKTAAIRERNDRFRRAGPLLGCGTGMGRWVITQGVLALGPDAFAEVVAAVQAFHAFSEANDPHHEHDFGAFVLFGEQLFWKIDYYDRTLRFGSDDPSDPKLTCRVLTVMLASEY